MTSLAIPCSWSGNGLHFSSIISFITTEAQCTASISTKQNNVRWCSQGNQRVLPFLEPVLKLTYAGLLRLLLQLEQGRNPSSTTFLSLFQSHTDSMPYTLTPISPSVPLIMGYGKYLPPPCTKPLGLKFSSHHHQGWCLTLLPTFPSTLAAPDALENHELCLCVNETNKCGAEYPHTHTHLETHSSSLSNWLVAVS